MKREFFDHRKIIEKLSRVAEKILSFLYCRHNADTILILNKIKEDVDVLSKYDMGVSLESLFSDLPLAQLESKIENLINAGYLKEINKKIYKLTEEGIELLCKYSRFDTLNRSK